MKKIGLIFILAALLLLARGGYAQVDPASSDESSGYDVTLAGRVVALTSGKPVPGMKLLFTRTNREQVLTADDSGKFQLTVPGKSQVRLSWNPSTTGSYIIDPEWHARGNYFAYAGMPDKDKTDLVLKVKVWPMRTLSGKVLGPDGKPFNNAYICVHSEVAPVQSDALGRFTLNVPADRDFDLLATDAMPVTPTPATTLFVPDLPESVRSPKGMTLGVRARLKASAAEATIQLAPTAPVTVKAVTPDGKPAAGLVLSATCVVTSTPLAYYSAPPKKTDSEGKFAITNAIPNGVYSLSWQASPENRDYDSGSATLDLAAFKPGEPPQIIVPQYLNALMGKVVNDQDQPVAEAKIQFLTLNLAPADLKGTIYTSDKNGNFTIPRLAAGRGKIKVAHDEYKSRTVESATDNFDCVIKLLPKGSASIYKIVAVDEQDKPVARAPLTMLTMSVDRERRTITTQSQALTTDDKGQAEFRTKDEKSSDTMQMVPMVNVLCDLPEYDMTLLALNPEGDEDVRLLLRKPGEHWGGQVVDSFGKPVAGALAAISAIAPELNQPTYQLYYELPQLQARSDADGRFSFPRISRKCAISLKITVDGYSMFENWVSPENDPKVYTLTQGGVIKGRVVNKTTGKPQVSGSVRCVGAVLVTSGAIGEDGTFTVANLTPGDYKLFYEPAEDDDRKWVPVAVPSVTVSAGPAPEANLELEAGIHVGGKLLNPKTGKPPQNPSEVSASLAGGTEQAASCEVKEETGEWQLYLAPGTYTLMYYVTGTSELTKVAEPIVIEKGKQYDNVKIDAKEEAGAAATEAPVSQ